MAEFKDASLWIKVAFLMITLGEAAEWFGFAIGLSGAFSSGGVEAMLIIGLLCYLVAVILALCIVFLDELKGNKPALICFIIFSFIAGIATIIGVAIWGGDNNRVGRRLSTYSTELAVLGGLMAILAGIFAILDIAGVKSSK